MHKRSQSGFAAIIVAVVLLLVLLGILITGSLIYKKNTSTSKESSTNQQPNSGQEIVQLSPEDRLKTSLLAYKVSYGGYPASSAAGWQKFVDQIRENSSKNKIEGVTDPFIVPGTDDTYAFTSDAPGAGEVQYRYPADCASNDVDFTSKPTGDYYAFRMLNSGSVRCFTYP